MNDNKDIKFTGDPVAFDGVEGKRDPKTGKGRFDLIPTEVYYPLFSKADHDWLLDCHPASILMAIAHERFIEAIYSYAMHNEHYAASSSEFWHGVWPMLQDLAIHFQKGAEHYGERNCQKGIPLWSFKDSAMRHATQVFEGKTDEPHKISVIWNCWMAQWTVIQEKEKESERRLLAVERAAEARVNRALGDNLKDAVTNLREVRKKLKAEKYKYMSDSAEYDVLSQSIEGLKRVINMLYSIAEQTGSSIVTDVQKPAAWQDAYNKIIEEMGKNAKETGIPWPPKEPEIIPDTRDDHNRTRLSDSPEVEEKKNDVDEMKKVINELSQLANELNIPVVTAQQASYTREEVEAIKKEAADKAIKDFLNDRSPENVDRIIKEIGAQRIIESLKTIPLNERQLFDTQFADLLSTPEGKDRARWFYGPDDLLKDLIDRVENKRGYGKDYRDYVPLLIKLNRAFEEYLQEKNQESKS